MYKRRDYLKLQLKKQVLYNETDNLTTFLKDSQFSHNAKTEIYTSVRPSTTATTFPTTEFPFSLSPIVVKPCPQTLSPQTP